MQGDFFQMDTAPILRVPIRVPGLSVLREVRTHGTGWSLSAASAARLAAGDGLATAVERGLEFIAAAIRDHLRWELSLIHI